MATRTPTFTPAQIAARAVEAWFAFAVTNIGAIATDHTPLDCPSIEGAREEVFAALVSEHAGRYPGEYEASTRESLALDAGYLIGVQVGLRLRNIGATK